MSILQVMNTKLHPPGIRESMIRRAHVQKKLLKMNQYTITLVYSGAGYGKSTSLALYLHDTNVNASWYSMTSQDDDFFPFLTYLIHSIQSKYPNFGMNIVNRMLARKTYLQEKEVLFIASLFINEIVALEEELIMIIDDFHHGEKSIEIMEFMENVLQHCPQNLHIVLSGRSKPKWSLLTKLKVEGRLLELTQNDLSLQKQELELLLSEVYDLQLSEEEVAAIYEVTEGWVIASGMIGQQLQDHRDLSMLIHNKSQSLEDLFQYIALEVISKQPPVVQTFLEQSSILEELSGAVCDYVLNMENADVMLKNLADKNMFIVPTGLKQYRYHALFKELLENKLEETFPNEYCKLNERAAKYYERKEIYEPMLNYLAKGKRFQDIASFLRSYGFKLLKEGKLQALCDFLQKIPVELKEEYYWLWFFEGELYRIRSEYKQAKACYYRAEELSGGCSDFRMNSLAHEGIARIYLDTIQPKKAERHLQLAISNREKSEHSTDEEKAELYYLIAENLINRGEATKAEKWLQRASDQNLSLEAYNIVSRLYLRTGRLMEGKRLLLKREKEQPFNKETHIQQSHRETALLLSIVEASLGNGEQCKRYSQKAIEQGLQMKSLYVEGCGWTRMGHAVQILSSYDHHLIPQCYETALNMMDEIQNERGRAEPYMGLCLYYGKQKNSYEQARHYGMLALEETEKVNDMWLTAYIKLALTIAAINEGNWEIAKQTIVETEGLFQECNDLYGQTLASLWHTFIAYSLKEWSVFDSAGLKLMQRVQYGHYTFLLTKQTLYGPADLQQFIPMLIEAQKRRLLDYLVSRILHELGYSQIDLHPGYTLRVQTLGEFKVYLGNQEVTDWQRGKAKALFEYFIIHQGSYIPKQQITDALWAEQDEKTADRDFKVALNALHNALEPERKARMEPFFIKRSGNSYGLNAESCYKLDAIEFEDCVLIGLEEKEQMQAKAFLEKGLKLYKGEYMPQLFYEEWCTHERERLQGIFFRGAEKMAQLSIAMNDPNSAIHWCELILKKEKTWEEAYRLLMYCYYLKNNRPQSIKWYQKCCAVLQEELAVEPLASTKDMYEMIIGTRR
ncbi:MAG: BTAD domain-containing putative transcriptional regulator [Bacillus sp. (in: firmicutes)]